MRMESTHVVQMLSAYHCAGLDVHIRTNNRCRNLGQSVDCSVAAWPQGYPPSPAQCLGGSPSSGKGSACMLVPAWGWGTPARGVFTPRLCGHHVEAAALARRVSLQLALLAGWFCTVPSDCFCISTFVLQFCPWLWNSEKMVPFGLLGWKTQENTAWQVHTDQNPTVSSTAVVVSSCTKPLAGLRL